MSSELILEIVTPFGKTIEESIVSCTVPGAHGQFQVYKDHAALVSTVNIGSIKIEYTDAKTAYLAVSGGFCEIKDNRVAVMVETAELADQIDVARAEASKQRAEERLEGKAAQVDTLRAEMALQRALNRLQVARLT